MTNPTKILPLLCPTVCSPRLLLEVRQFLVLGSLLFALSLSACYSGPRYLVPEGNSSAGVESPQASEAINNRDNGLNSGGKADAYSLEKPPSIPDLATGRTAPPTAGQFGEQLKTSSKRWFFGGGIGKTMANVSAVIVFPPYGLYLLGNAGLAMAGYKPVYVTDALPKTPGKYVRKAYDGITSVPGRLNALVAGKEYYSD